MENTDKVFLLSISGGGLKGILPAILLHELCSKINKKPHEIFDMFIGTSTGGIISYLYNCKQNYSTRDVVDFYTEDAVKKIFKKNFFRWPQNYFKSKYPEDQIEDVLKEKFKHDTLLTLKKPVITTAYDTEKRQAVFINSTQEKFEDLKIWKCARATSAAPTYFPPFKLDDMCLIDGGMFANNPALFGCIEAKKLFPYKEVVLVEIGTGSSTLPYNYEDVKDWNYIQWGLNLYDIVNDGQADTTSYALKRILNKENHYLFDTILSKELNDMDDLDNIGELINLTYDCIRGEWRDKLQELCSILK